MVPSHSTSSSFTYGLLRHGETIWNSEKRVQGHGNSPLTAVGKIQIQKWAEHLAHNGWRRIICSDLGRVRETVAIVNSVLHLPVTEDPRLREQHWGEWEGLKVDDVRRDCADELAIQVAAGWGFRPPGGESRIEILQRVLDALASSRQSFAEEKILLVCHLGVIKCVVYHIAGRKFLPEEPPLTQKGCIHEIHYSPDGYRLGKLNITAGNEKS